MTNNQQKYLIEYEKYKNVILSKGVYHKKDASHIQYEIKNINYEAEEVHLKNIKSNNELIKTLHWCRKNLTKTDFV
jgi:hypothetical protein